MPVSSAPPEAPPAEKMPMSQPMLRPLGFGEVLDGAFTLYRRHFPTLFATALIAIIPITLLMSSIENVSLAMDRSGAISPAMANRVLLSFPPLMLLWGVVWAALTHQTANAYQGRAPSLRGGYTAAVRALPRLIGSGIVISLIATALALCISLVAGVIVATLLAIGAGTLPTATMGVVMLLAGAATLVGMAAIFAVVPAIVVEGAGPWSALKRSSRLARGAHARIVGVMVVCSLIVVLPTVGLAVAVGMGAALWDSAAAVSLSPVQLFAQQLIAITTGALTTPFIVGCVTVLYFDRRVRTEAYDLEVAADSLVAQT